MTDVLWVDARFYDFLNCLDASPCYGWMNSNATVRNATQALANRLSAVYPQIVATEKFRNLYVVRARVLSRLIVCVF